MVSLHPPWEGGKLPPVRSQTLRGDHGQCPAPHTPPQQRFGIGREKFGQEIPELFNSTSGIKRSWDFEVLGLSIHHGRMQSSPVRSQILRGIILVPPYPPSSVLGLGGRGLGRKFLICSAPKSGVKWSWDFGIWGLSIRSVMMLPLLRTQTLCGDHGESPASHTPPKQRFGCRGEEFGPRLIPIHVFIPNKAAPNQAGQLQPRPCPSLFYPVPQREQTPGSKGIVPGKEPRPRAGGTLFPPAPSRGHFLDVPAQERVWHCPGLGQIREEPNL